MRSRSAALNAPSKSSGLRTSSDTMSTHVVHPPGGKWLIGLGEQMFGMTPFGPFTVQPTTVCNARITPGRRSNPPSFVIAGEHEQRKGGRVAPDRRLRLGRALLDLYRAYREMRERDGIARECFGGLAVLAGGPGQKPITDTEATAYVAELRDKLDLVAGGVPCPPFSIAGKQLGALFAGASCAGSAEAAKYGASPLAAPNGLGTITNLAFLARALETLARQGNLAEALQQLARAVDVPPVDPRREADHRCGDADDAAGRAAAAHVAAEAQGGVGRVPLAADAADLGGVARLHRVDGQRRCDRDQRQQVDGIEGMRHQEALRKLHVLLQVAGQQAARGMEMARSAVADTERRNSYTSEFTSSAVASI